MVLCATVALAWPFPVPAQTDEERQLVSVLLSDASLREKGPACGRLKQIGTAAAIPALAPLLTDERLSHSARYALESLPFPEAGAALIAALEKTTGPTRAGIVDSLGERRELRAVPELVQLLTDPDPLVASAAAAALGKIGGPSAVEALKAARPEAPAPVQRTMADALLRCADRLRAEGHGPEAAALYRELFDQQEAEHVRVAAYRGLVLASFVVGQGSAVPGPQTIALLTEALQGDDRAAQLAALPLVREIGGPEATESFASLLGKTSPALQVALLEALSQRGDGTAARFVVGALAPSGPVRIAALRTLGELGDASVVPLLARTAAEAAGEEQEAARQSLAQLRRGDVQQALLDLLPNAPLPVRVELVRALANRGDRAAIPTLLKMAEGAEEPVQIASLEALGTLGNDHDVAALIDLLVRAKTEAVREAGEAALKSVSGRSKQPQSLIPSLLAARPPANVPAQCALLRVVGWIGGPEALAALRAGVQDPNPEVRQAAVRTMADFAGLEALPDLLVLGRQAPTSTERILALRGYWRLVGLAGSHPLEERLRLCQEGLAVAERPEEKRLGLAELAKLPLPAALELARQSGRDEAVRAEAQLASVQIAARLLATHRAAAEAALRQVLAEASADQVRAEAQTALKALEQHADYVTPWLVAGPYRNGQQCQQLFDVPFGPETADAGRVEWRMASAPADPLLFWQVDLANVVGGDHCVVYLKTRVYAPQEQPVLLAIGTDDGIKLWVNGELVHAHNAVRGLTPDQDQAQARLKQGWNDFLAKITQHTLGCGACVRLRAADGSRIEGLRCDPAGDPERDARPGVGG